MKKMVFKKKTIATIIVGILCFACAFAAAFVDIKGDLSFGKNYKYVASGSIVVTLRTLADTPVANGYTKSGEIQTNQTANVGDALPTPVNFTNSNGATFIFLGWHKANGSVVTAVQATDNDFTAHWRANVTSGSGLKAAESIYVREIYIMNDIVLDQAPVTTNVQLAGGTGQSTDNVVFQALAPIKIFGNNHSIFAYVTGTNAAGICNTRPSDYVMFYTGSNGSLEISDLTMYGGAKQAVAIYNSTATMTNCIVSRSGSNTLCGGAIVVSTSGKLKAKNCNFKRNVAQYAGAILIKVSSTALLENCVVNENRNVAVGQACGGGAMEIQSGCKLYFVNSTLSNNQSTEIGGGVNGNNGANMYIINSTVTGNVSSGAADNFRHGGGLGGNNVHIHVYNSIVENNYFYNTEKKVATPCDIAFYKSGDAPDAHNSIIGSVYNSDSRDVTSTYVGGATTNKVGNLANDFYRYDEINLLAADGTVWATLPNAKSPIITDDKIYLFAGTSTALSGGEYVYFNGDDINNIRFGHGIEGAAITTVVGSPTIADKITLFKNGVARDQPQIVMGALYSIPPNERYAKITGQVAGEGSVDGYSIFHNYYLVGKDATFVAAANHGYAFMGYYDVTARPSGQTGGGAYLSSNLSYTFNVKSDADLVLEARFVSSSDVSVYFTTYGGAMQGFLVDVENQVYKNAYDISWAATAPKPTYTDSGKFVKWYSDSTFKTVATFTDKSIKNYYAKVTDSITYTFKDDANALITGVTNSNLNTHVRNEEMIFAQPTFPNYIFVEWRDSQDKPITKLEQTAKGAQAITGVFRQRTISFEGLMGASPDTIASIKINGQAVTLQSVTKVGLIFKGWSFTINGVNRTIPNGGQFTAEYATLMETYNIGNLVLTAVFVEKLYVNFVDLTPQTYTYNSGAQEFVVKTESAYSAETGFVVKYFSGGAYVDTKPTNVGAYNVQISRVKTGDYEPYIKEIPSGLIIARKALTQPTLSGSYIYNGAAQIATLDGVDSATMTVAQSSPTNAGVYNTAIKVTLNDKDNYKWVGELDTISEIFIVWTINKLQLSVANASISDKIYDGNTTADALIGAVSGIVAADKTAGVNVTIASANFENDSAGTNKQVRIVYQVVADTHANYIAPTTGVQNATIKPATITYNASGYSGVYDGKGHKISITDITTKNNQSISTTYCDSENGIYVAEPFVYTNNTNGTKIVFFKISAPNHNLIVASATIAISKANVTISALALTAKKYGDINDTRQTNFEVSSSNVIGVNSESNISGAFTFDFIANSLQLSSGKLLKVDRYDIDYTFNSHNDNYNNLSGKTTFEVSKVDITATFSNFSNLVYNGKEQEVAVGLNNVKVGDKVFVEITYGAAKVCDAATYTATALVVGASDPRSVDASNYNFSGATQQFSIAPFIVTATIADITSGYVYDGTPKTTTANNTAMFNGDGLTIDLKYKLGADTGHINAGSWEVSIASVSVTKGLSTNYTIIATDIGAMVISQAALPAIKTISDAVYNGNKQAPTVEISGLTFGRDFTLAWDDGALLNATTYTVTATGNGNYNGASKQTYVITKAIVAEPTAGSKVYNGKVLTSDIATTSIVSVTTNNGGIDVGEYNVVISLVDYSNYKWLSGADVPTRTLKFVITQAENAITNLNLKSWVYAKTANAPTCDCNFGNAIFTYSAQENSGYTARVPSDIGVWFVKASIEGTKNYKGAQAVQTFLIIAYTYTIAFDNGFGGDQTMHFQSRVCNDGVALPANAFERVGYAFVGWKIADSDIVLKDGATDNIGDGRRSAITLVAQWKMNMFTYAFFNEDLSLIFAKTTNFGDKIDIPTSPIKADSAGCSYRFVGWDKPIPETLTSDLVFVAKFAVKIISGDIDQKVSDDKKNRDILVVLPDNSESVLSMTIQDITETRLINDIDNVLKDTSINEYGANKVLKVYLLKDGKEIQFAGKYTVRLKEKARANFDIKIVQVVNDEMVEINYEREGDYIVFDTISLGNIVVLEQNADANLWLLVVANMVVLLLELAYIIFRKKPIKASKPDSSKGTKTNAFAFAPLGLLGAINVIPMYLQILLAAQTIVVIVLAVWIMIVLCKNKMKKKEKDTVAQSNQQPQLDGAELETLTQVDAAEIATEKAITEKVIAEVANEVATEGTSEKKEVAEKKSRKKKSQE